VSLVVFAQQKYREQTVLLLTKSTTTLIQTHCLLIARITYSVKKIICSLLTKIHEMKSMYVYILECSDKTYYTGVTNDLDRRLAEHNDGENPASYTFSRRPLILKYFQEHNDPIDAIEWEKKIKKWSKAKKEALMQENFQLLPSLSKKKFKK
jgi:putative endonuclease